MIYVVATFRLRPAALEPFVEAAYLLIDAARREAGCLYYDLHASVTDPDRLMCHEQWHDRAAFDQHLATPHLAAFSAAIAPLVLNSRVEIITPGQIDTLRPNFAAHWQYHGATNMELPVTKPALAALFVAALLTPISAAAAQASIQLELGTASDFERRVMLYDCSAGEPFSVTYINAAPNFLALVPIAEEPEPLVFAAVTSASGVRYAAGHWIWSTSGVDASLHDVTLGDDAEPVLTCSELNNTP